MLKNYFRIAWRTLLKGKTYSAINITGLAIGLASSILILLWVQNELRFDRFHKNAGQIYRVASDFGDSKSAANSAGMPAGLKAEMPVIKNTVRLGQSTSTLLETGNKKFEVKRVFYADESFMDVFSYPLVKGDRATALKQVDAVLMTQEMATKYFGHEDPIGKVIRKDNQENVVVTGVLADIPANSDLQFDFILPMASLAKTFDDLKNNTWDNFNLLDYVQLDKSFDPSAPNLLRLEKQIDRIFQKHSPGTKAHFQLQPLTGIHLAPERLGDLPGHGNAQYVNIFFIIAILILVVACINFMNLATARSARRAKEIGLRKVSGAVRAQLIVQLAKISQELNPAYPFKFDFLDQDLANLYKGEQQMGNIFNLFAILGIFISSLGLYGLSAFIAEQRTKEIGVRKVLGASVLNLVYLLSSGITRLILIAIVIAIPLSWYAVNRWLTGFAYHINISWLIFIGASLAVLAIAWLTVGFESIKAAIVNPIKSLKNE